MGNRTLKPVKACLSRNDRDAARICLSREEIGKIHGVERTLKKLLQDLTASLGASLALIKLHTKELTLRVDSDTRPLPHAGALVREFDQWLEQSPDQTTLEGELAFESADRDTPTTTAVRAFSSWRSQTLPGSSRGATKT